MIFHIAKKEIREMSRTGQFKWMFGIVILLSAVAIFVSHRQWQDKNLQREQAEANARTLWLAQGSINPHNAAHYGTFAFKPQFPLSLIDPGVEKYTGISIFLESHSRNEADNVAAADQTGLSRFGDLTPDFILLFIVPLMIIALGHHSITREKEQGTIQIIKTQGVSNKQLILGKWLGNYLPITALTTALFLLAAVFIQDLNWKFLAMMWLVYLVYFAVINSITLIISSLAKAPAFHWLHSWLFGLLVVLPFQRWPAVTPMRNILIQPVRSSKRP